MNIVPLACDDDSYNSMELFFLYLKGLPVKISIKWCISVAEDWFYLKNSAYPDEMPPYAAFHLGLHCLTKYLFIGIQIEKSCSRSI